MTFGLYLSGNFFGVLGEDSALGRGFRPEEDQAEGRDPVVVVGHDFWIGQFGAKASVVGSRVRLNGIEFTMIGVAPEHFTGIDTVIRPQLFVPLAMAPRMSRKNYLHDRDLGWLFIKGRLKPGVRLEQAQADVGGLSAGLEKMHSQAARPAPPAHPTPPRSASSPQPGRSWPPWYASPGYVAPVSSWRLRPTNVY